MPDQEQVLVISSLSASRNWRCHLTMTSNSCANGMECVHGRRKEDFAEKSKVLLLRKRVQLSSSNSLHVNRNHRKVSFSGSSSFSTLTVHGWILQTLILSSDLKCVDRVSIFVFNLLSVLHALCFFLRRCDPELTSQFLALLNTIRPMTGSFFSSF